MKAGVPVWYRNPLLKPAIENVKCSKDTNVVKTDTNVINPGFSKAIITRDMQ